MSFFERLLGRSASKKEKPGREINVILWDLRGMTEDERRGYKPGFYFIVGPTTKGMAEHPDFILNLTPYFTQVINNQGFNEGEGLKRPIDDQGDIMVYPSWKYTEIGYYEEDHALVVKAEPLDKNVLENIPVDPQRKQALSSITVPL